jgi:hypothetical protein
MWYIALARAITQVQALSECKRFKNDFRLSDNVGLQFLDVGLAGQGQVAVVLREEDAGLHRTNQLGEWPAGVGGRRLRRPRPFQQQRHRVNVCTGPVLLADRLHHSEIFRLRGNL